MANNTVSIDARHPEKKIARRLIVKDEFGKGGMSVLHDAFDANLMRNVAMKVLLKDNIKDDHSHYQMVSEAQITAQLDHPNIVPIYEIGLDKNKQLFFTMKKIHGKPLFELINEKEIASQTERYLFRMIQIMLKVCDAVSYAHSKGVLHRDLKPDNIMVGEFGQVYLMDWGVARVNVSQNETPLNQGNMVPGIKKRKKYIPKAEKSGSLIGTPCYMSPEQAAGNMNAIDERSDVFSLGAILYEIITGTFAISGKNFMEMLANAKKCEFQAPDERVSYPLPKAIVNITLKAMHKEPPERYQSVEELRKDLEVFLEGSGRFPERTYNPGDLIVKEGDLGNEAFIIRSGQCRVFKTINNEKKEIRIMGANESFGEIAIFTDESRSASVEALSGVTVAVITKQYFNEEIGLGAWIDPFIRGLAERLREKDQRVTELEELLARKTE